MNNNIDLLLKRALLFPNDDRTIYRLITFQNTPEKEIYKFI